MSKIIILPKKRKAKPLDALISFSDTTLNKSAQVKVGMGKTINLGNYEFMRVDISIDMPTKISKISKSKAVIIEYIEKELDKQVKKILTISERDKNED